MSRPAILFVCLGNICRSPLAEAALRAEAEKAGLDMIVDSAGTGDWHVGSPPDARAQAVALARGIDISHYRGRQVSAEDFRRFTHVFALDTDNLRNLRRIRPSDGTASLQLLMDLVPGRAGSGVTDPYYGDEAGFEITWDDVTRAAAALVARLERGTA
ncbi:MAG TPA: low molecular weight phosphotyrosine protein phosphatase [Sphingobium sp.]|jgi:protein-tyrosine phosphatase|uniref:low molecular weight protein-tyrosine-phosphatase n=1 Tax=unclassified Sphingobium TaxID=2611147 RepID=UPI0007F3BF02|nr:MULTISPECIES: low molecular weight protein-tyrosine-phosphatase [unclassified Sphingobium]OAN52042.1 phosphotyrosine protein phosphatase [Sphingobium sp. TCM1]WIW88232.1 low molecular weight protein-tyrosine-phosphatase [Sphingobium sp. V4]HAF43173.1 low molecular weight phosphotyrosine protein phosphatase [Sphingobium sp.]